MVTPNSHCNLIQSQTALIRTHKSIRNAGYGDSHGYPYIQRSVSSSTIVSANPVRAQARVRADQALDPVGAHEGGADSRLDLVTRDPGHHRRHFIERVADAGAGSTDSGLREASMIESYRPRATMRSTQQFSITLPNEMADAVKAKVAGGEYATESEVIREGLRTLMARDRAVETWLREKVVPAALALDAEPGSALTAAQVRKHLAQKRLARARMGKA